MGLGKGKTEHAGPRDTARKDGHWGFTEEAKEWASRARRRDEERELREELDGAEAARRSGERPGGDAPKAPDESRVDTRPARSTSR
jgi:hypothetical protein